MQLIHVKTGKKLKKDMKSLIDEDIFNNYSEIVREGIRDLINRYSNEFK